MRLSEYQFFSQHICKNAHSPISKPFASMQNTINRVEEVTREEERKRKEKDQGNKSFAEKAVVFLLQSVLCETEVQWPTAYSAGTPGQGQRTSHPTGTPPRVAQGPSNSAEPVCQ